MWRYFIQFCFFMPANYIISSLYMVGNSLISDNFFTARVGCGEVLAQTRLYSSFSQHLVCKSLLPRGC